jgi:hypothetical protein
VKTALRKAGEIKPPPASAVFGRGDHVLAC